MATDCIAYDNNNWLNGLFYAVESFETVFRPSMARQFDIHLENLYSKFRVLKKQKNVAAIAQPTGVRECENDS